MENQEILNVSIEDGAYIFFIKEKNSYFLRFNKAGGNSMLKILNQLSVDGYNFIRLCGFQVLDTYIEEANSFFDKNSDNLEIEKAITKNDSFIYSQEYLDPFKYNTLRLLLNAEQIIEFSNDINNLLKRNDGNLKIEIKSENNIKEKRFLILELENYPPLRKRNHNLHLM